MTERFRVGRSNEKNGRRRTEVFKRGALGIFLIGDEVIAQVAEQVFLISKSGSLSRAAASAELTMMSTPPALPGDVSAIIWWSVSQVFWPLMRQRWNLTVSARTKAGGAQSLDSPARILKRPARSASGMPSMMLN